MQDSSIKNKSRQRVSNKNRRRNSSAKITLEAKELIDGIKKFDSAAWEYIEQLAQAVHQLNGLKDSKLSPSLYIVGGAHRDLLRKLTPNNLDCVMIGVEPEQALKIVAATCPTLERTRDRDFHERLVVKSAANTEIRIDLPRIRGAKKEYNFENGRADLTLKTYLKSLDFTINTLALDPLKNELFDFYNGLKDLKRRVIDIVDPNYIQPRFKSSYPLIYRAARLSANLDLSPSQRLITSFRQLVKRKSHQQIAADYLNSDITSLLVEGIYPEQGLLLLHKLNLLEHHFSILSDFPKNQRTQILANALFALCKLQEQIITSNLPIEEHKTRLLATFLKPLTDPLNSFAQVEHCVEHSLSTLNLPHLKHRIMALIA